MDCLTLNCDTPPTKIPPTTCIGTSNINPLELTIDLRPFKCLKSLTILGIQPKNLIELGTSRNTVHHLIVTDATIDKISDILLCDDVHKGDGSIEKVILTIFY